MNPRSLLTFTLSKSQLSGHFRPSNSYRFPTWDNLTKSGFSKNTRTLATMSKLNINSKLRMNSGYDIPVLGYGVYQTPHAICEEVTSHALKTGYRHIDSAAAYRNEAPCALAMKNSKIPRSEIFFTSKIPPKSLSYEKTKSQVEETLKVTGLDYIDLMLIHSPYGGPEARKGAWKALVEAQEEGKIRSIGVSNYGVHHLDELEKYIASLESSLGKGKGGIISVNQCELHPWLARPDIVSWCEKRGIVMEAYSPIIRATRNDEEILQQQMKKHGKTAAQILLRWSMQMGFVPLPKSVTPSRIEENTGLYDFELSRDDMKVLDTKEYKPCAWDPTVASLED